MGTLQGQKFFKGSPYLPVPPSPVQWEPGKQMHICGLSNENRQVGDSGAQGQP